MMIAGAVCAILMSVMTGASVLPFSIALPLKYPMLKLFWRISCMIPQLHIIAFIQLAFFRRDFKIKTVFEKKNLQLILAAGVLNAAIQATLILSGTFTVITHTSIILNLAGPNLVIWRIISKQGIHRYEIFGSALGFIGCLVSVFDKEA